MSDDDLYRLHTKAAGPARMLGARYAHKMITPEQATKAMTRAP